MRHTNAIGRQHHATLSRGWLPTGNIAWRRTRQPATTTPCWPLHTGAAAAHVGVRVPPHVVPPRRASPSQGMQPAVCVAAQHGCLQRAAADLSRVVLHPLAAQPRLRGSHAAPPPQRTALAQVLPALRTTGCMRLHVRRVLHELVQGACPPLASSALMKLLINQLQVVCPPQSFNRLFAKPSRRTGYSL